MRNYIFITGSTGNIGSHLAQQLEQEQIQFSAGVNTKVTKENQVFIDYNNVNSLIKAFQGHDTVFLLFPMNEYMVDWANNAIQAAKNANVKYLVRSSGAGADSSSTFFMPHVQGTIDDAIKESGISYTITRPASFMQNFVNLLAHDIKNGEVYLPVGDGKIGPVDVRDIATVNKHVLIAPKEYAKQELDITGPECFSYGEALEIISKTTGKPVSFSDVSASAAIESMKTYGMSDFNIRMVSSLYEIIRHGYAEMTTDTVKDITGHNPISFQQFVEENASGWK